MSLSIFDRVIKLYLLQGPGSEAPASDALLAVSKLAETSWSKETEILPWQG